jgi:hypothetical protein
MGKKAFAGRSRPSLFHRSRPFQELEFLPHALSADGRQPKVEACPASKEILTPPMAPETESELLGFNISIDTGALNPPK